MFASQEGWIHISVGNELKKYIRNDEKDDLVTRHVQSASLVPVEQLAPIIGQCMQEFADHGSTFFILDRFRRHMSQISHMQTVVSHYR